MFTESAERDRHPVGYPVSEWSNRPGYEYAIHSHPYKKILRCLEGSIVFHLPDRDVTLSAGDQMVVEPGVEHSATVGVSGVRCVETHIS
jgi:quercetin dioxygenase-like cupin family protein